MAIKVSDKLQQAIDKLIINDVYLKNAKAHCNDDFDPKSANQLEGLLVQQMHVVYKYNTPRNLDNKTNLLISI